MSGTTAQLSCQQCNNRKKKCSKTIPCTACTKAGIQCVPVQRSRLPRGRSGNKKLGQTALKDRVGRLEAIISRLKEAPPGGHPDVHPVTGQQKALPDFVAPAFWSELTAAVAGVKDALEGDDEFESVTDDSSTATPASGDGSDPHSLLFEPSNSLSPAQDDDHLSPEMKIMLLDVYKARVDAIFKAVHWPSTYARIKSPQGEVQNGRIQLRALEWAIYFTATCSLLDHELHERQHLVLSLRQAAEQALAHASLLTTTNLTVLQAFVIYLAGLRASQANAQQWTLTATAIRIASAQGIPSQLTGPSKTFHQELQRRVWFCIGILDMQSAFDRGSRPLLQSSDFEVLPLELDDVDLEVQSNMSFHASNPGVLNEMSFSITTYRAMICQRRLAEIGSSTDDNGVSMQKQNAVIADFESHVNGLRAIRPHMQSSIDKFTAIVAEASLVAMRLLMYRPLYQRKSHPPDPEGFDVLATATQVLERTQEKRSSTEFTQYSWYSWVKWYALAIVLAELCTARGAQADRAWIFAQQAFEDYATIVADTRSGLLWRPIVKLMRKVREVRGVKGDKRQVGQPSDPSFAYAMKDWTMDSMMQEKTSAALLDLDTDMAGVNHSLLYWDSLVNDIMLDDHIDWNFEWGVET